MTQEEKSRIIADIKRRGWLMNKKTEEQLSAEYNKQVEKRIEQKEMVINNLTNLYHLFQANEEMNVGLKRQYINELIDNTFIEKLYVSFS